MAYHLCDVDVGEPMRDVSLRSDEHGVGVVVRNHGKPVTFVLAALPAGTQLSADRLDELLGPVDAIGVVRGVLSDEFGPSSSEGPIPVITIAVCTHARPERLARCLDALGRSLAAAPAPIVGRVTVLVVDNAPPDDETAEVVRSLSWPQYHVEPVAGLDFARNRALAEAKGQVLAFIDDDVVVEQRYVTELARAWQRERGTGCITGLVLPYALETEAQVRFEERGGFRRGFHRLSWEGASQAGNRLYPFGAGIFGAGCNMSFDRSLLLDLGGFDEALDTGRPLPGGGDIDMFFRVLRAGARLSYEPSVVVRHEHRRELSELRHQYYTWGTGFMAFLAKWYPRVDAADRKTIRAMVRWFFGRYQASLLASAARRRRGLTFGMVLAEMRGGIVGLAGEYRRSQNRVARLRAAAEVESP